MKSSKSTPKKLNGKAYKFAIILSRYNDDIGKELLKNTQENLLKNGVKEKNIDLFRVPGALEIPITANALALKDKYDAIICLGVVIKGETPHFDLVANECYRGLMDISLCSDTPIIFGVLAANNVKQAKDRAAKGKLNKGKEYAEGAIEMAMLLER
jgi:6,7-dimethyl-8-ribityllumazine synthase